MVAGIIYMLAEAKAQGQQLLCTDATKVTHHTRHLNVGLHNVLLGA